MKLFRCAFFVPVLISFSFRDVHSTKKRAKSHPLITAISFTQSTKIMSTAKSKTDKSDGAGKLQQAPAVSRDAQGRINVQRVQNVLLVWLDGNIDKNNDDCKNNITQLRGSVHNIKTFTDSDECVDFLTDIYSEKVIMIISGAFCQQTIPLIHDIAQLHSVFVFCKNETEHEKWTKAWSKIKGIFTEISPICEALKQAGRQYEINDISISFMNTSGDVSKKNLDQLDCSFMYTQILKEILLTIKFEQEHIKQFTDYCQEQFANNDHDLDTISKLERTYREQTPVWWYTSPYFLYSMLNQALRLMDVDIIMNMGFFISDLHRHIEQLHSMQVDGNHSGDIFTLYRGQGLSKTDFNQLKDIKGGLIAFNNFLSTSKNRDVSLMFAESNLSNPDMVGILFVITVEPNPSTTPFASINEVGYYGGKEDEVLFSMQSVFRIQNIASMSDNNRLYQVQLTLTSDNDKDLRVLTETIREETEGSTGWDSLGELLRKMGRFDKAEEVYHVLVDRTTNESERATIYGQLGLLNYHQGKYHEAIKFNEKSLEIKQQSLPPNDPSLGDSYNKIGMVYESMGDYSTALSNYEKALEIQQQSLPPNHLRLGDSYNNTAIVFAKMGEYSRALSNHQKALEIRQSLPPNHPSLGDSYNNIGMVYDSMGDYSTAVSNYEKALEIRQQSLPPSHPSLGAYYNNIGVVYESMGDYSTALSNYEKALEIRQQSLSPNHLSLSTAYNNIGEVYDTMGDYSKALSNYEKALEIRQQSLPPNHPSLGDSYNKIGMLYGSMGDHSTALSNYERALEIVQQSRPLNHHDLSASYNNIGVVYDTMGDYSKALSYHEKALEIVQQSLPLNHPDLAELYFNIGSLCEKMGDYSKARSFYKRAVEIGQSSLPPNHPELRKWKKQLKYVERNL